ASFPEICVDYRYPKPKISRRAPSSAAAMRAQPHSRIGVPPALLAMGPQEAKDLSLSGTEAIIARLEKALRAERPRGQSRNWAYVINRHMRILTALGHERDWLEKLKASDVSRQGGKEGVLGKPSQALRDSNRLSSSRKEARLTGTAAS